MTTTAQALKSQETHLLAEIKRLEEELTSTRLMLKNHRLKMDEQLHTPVRVRKVEEARLRVFVTGLREREIILKVERKGRPDITLRVSRGRIGPSQRGLIFLAAEYSEPYKHLGFRRVDDVKHFALHVIELRRAVDEFKTQEPSR